MPQVQILVVEDELIIAKDIEYRLKTAGYQVIAICSKGQEAIEAAASTHPDLVLMDIALKGDMDGITAASRIRENVDIPVVYLTAHSDPVTLQRAKITDPFGYLLKPFEEKELITIVEMALYKFQMEKSLRDRERWLSTVLNSIGDAVITTDIQGCVTFMNPVAEQLTGWVQAKAVGKSADEIFKLAGKDSQTLIESPVKQVLKENIQLGLTDHTFLISKNGSPKTISYDAAPIKDDQDRVTGVVLTFRDITDRTRAEAERDEQRLMLKALLDTTPDIVVFKDRDSNYRSCSERYRRLSVPHISMDELVKMSDTDIFSQEETERFRNEELRVMETGQTLMAEHRLQTKEGTRWFEAVKMPLRNEAGEIVGVFTSERDITDRLQAEAERDEQRRMLRAVLDTLPDFIIFKDRDSIFRVSNKGFCDFVGLSEDDLIGKSDFDVFPPEDAQQYRQEEIQVMATEQTFVNIHQLQGPNGVHWDEAIKTPLRNEQGQIIGVLTTGRDITERMKAEEALRKSEEQYRSLVENMSDIVFTLDTAGRFTYVSPAVTQVAGYDPDELTGMLFTEFIYPNDLPKVMTGFGTVPAGESLVLEFRAFRKDGSIIHIRSAGRPLMEQGQRVGVSGVLSDITNRKQYEESLRRHALEMTALYETSLEISSQKDVPTLLQAIVRRAANLVDGDGGGLYLVKPDGETLELVVSYNLPRDYTGSTIRLGEGLAGRVAQNGESMMVADYQNWTEKSAAFTDGGFRRVLGAPLKVGQRVIGVLDVTDNTKIGPFRDEDIKLVSLFADQAAIAFENARLHEATERELAERKRAEESLRRERDFTASILDTTEALVIVMDPQGYIRLFNRKCEEVSGYSKEEAINKVYWDFLIPPGDRERVKKVLGSWPGQSPPVSDEGTWLTKEGKQVPLAWRNAVLPGSKPEEALFIGSGLDISERLAHEQLIERHNRELTILYEASRAANSTLDPTEALGQVVHILARIGNYPFASAHIQEGGKLLLCESTGYETLLLEIEPSVGVHGRVLRTGQPQFVPDASQDPDFISLKHDLTSEICVPVKIDDQVVGTLNIETNDPQNPLTGTDFHLMLALADQMSLVMHNAYLYQRLDAERQQVEHFNQQLLALQQISTTIVSHLDLGDLFNFVARSATELLHGDSGSISLFETDNTLTIHGSYGLQAETTRRIQHKLGQSITGIVAQTGKPIIANNVAADPHFDKIGAEKENFQAMISMPLLAGKNVIGVLNVHSKTQVHAFDQNHLHILSLLANQAAVAIENARLYNVTAEFEERYRSLFEKSLDGILLIDSQNGKSSTRIRPSRTCSGTLWKI